MRDDLAIDVASRACAARLGVRLEYAAMTGNEAEHTLLLDRAASC